MGLLITALLFLSVIVLICGSTLVRIGLHRLFLRGFNQRASDGKEIPLTWSAQNGIGTLGATGLLARAGTNRPVSKDITGQPVLRSTLGVRVISVGLSGVLIYMMFGVPDQFVVDNIFVTFPIVAGLIYAMAHTHMSYLRYDNDGIEVLSWRFTPARAAWKDVIHLQDNGHYLYVFRLSDGSKLEVLKYMTGMREFLTYAQARIAQEDQY